jgi:hypothetical protein
MHRLGEKNKYIGFLFMKISKDYFALGNDGIHNVSVGHAKELSKYSDKLTHIVTTGLDARYDQVTMVEADSLEEIHGAAVEFKMGAKAKYIEISDIIIGVKAPPRSEQIKR